MQFMTRVKRLKSKSQSHPSGPAFFFFFFLKKHTQNQYIQYLGCPVTLFIMMTLSAISPNLLKYARSVSEKKRCKLSVNNSNSVIVIAAFLPSLANIKFLFSVQFLYLKDCFLGLIIK